MNVSKFNGKFNPFYANRSKNIKAKKESRAAKKTFYHSARWEKLRQLTLRTFPLCARCELMGVVTEAEVVDHILLFKDSNDTLATDSDNLRSLCRKCHGAVTWDEQRVGRELMQQYEDGLSIEEIAAIKYKSDTHICDEDGYPL